MINFVSKRKICTHTSRLLLQLPESSRIEPSLRARKQHKVKDLRWRWRSDDDEPRIFTLWATLVNSRSDAGSTKNLSIIQDPDIWMSTSSMRDDTRIK